MEYKFRGKRIDKNEWVYGSLVQLGCFSYIHTGTVETVDIVRDGAVIAEQEIDVHYEVISASVGMWTGLKDKKGKGKEVFGSDVIGSMNGILFEVYWADKSAQWRVRFWNTDHKGQDRMSLAVALNNSYMKIKGNIHENPELLE
jgi:uncharacterized phage protein (TIGR01671 family)